MTNENKDEDIRERLCCRVANLAANDILSRPEIEGFENTRFRGTTELEEGINLWLLNHAIFTEDALTKARKEPS